MNMESKRLNAKIGWLRVVGGCLLVFLLVQAIYVALTYQRLQYLDEVVLNMCGPYLNDSRCIASAVELLMFSTQWQAVKFIFYFIFCMPALWLVFRGDKGASMVGLTIVGVINAFIFVVTATEVSVEPFAILFITGFTALLISRKNRKRVIANAA